MEDPNTEEKIESSKYVVLGNVDSGKSSTIAVLEKNVLDNGNGSARSLILKYKHELGTGRTSTHNPHYIINQNEITTLIDLCGHERYFKTTLFGVMGLFADYGIITVGANMGISSVNKTDSTGSIGFTATNGMFSEHFALLVSNKIPFIVVVTKIDLSNSHILQNLKKDLERLTKRNKKELFYFEENEVEIEGSYIKESHKQIINAFHERKTTIVPVVFISNKTGQNVNFLRNFITTIKSRNFLEKKNLIPKLINPKTVNYPSIMFIDSTFNVKGIGIILSGTLKYGSLTVGQKVFVGPINNTYISITIKSLQNCISENVNVLQENESGSMGIRLESKGAFHKNMFAKGQVVTTNANFCMEYTCYTFNCDIAVFNHPTTIKNGFQTVIHCATTRQTAKFKFNENKFLRAYSKENITIKFMFRPEFILPGTIFMFRDGRTKGMGRVNSGLNFLKDTAEQIKPKKITSKRAERIERKKLRGERLK